MNPQPALPAPVDTLQVERQQKLDQVTSRVIDHAEAIAQTVIKGAKSKDKTCLEVYYKYLYKPAQEEIAAVKSEQPSGPLPISFQIAQAQIKLAIQNGKGKPPIAVTSAEFNELPEERQKEIQQDYKLTIVETNPLILPVSSDGASPAPTDGTVASPQVIVPSGPPANKTCQECGTAFHSNQPLAKWCSTCRKTRSLRALAESRKARGKVLTPAMRELLEPETNGSGSLGELTR